MNASVKSQEARERLSRWEEVIFPSYRIQQPSRPAQRLLPRWLEIQQQSGKGKDLTEHGNE